MQRTLCKSTLSLSGPGSAVGIATGYGLDGQGIEFRWGRDFPHLYRSVLGPTHPPVQWVPGLSRVLKAAGEWRWPLTPSSAVVKKEKSYTSTHPLGRTACTEPQCLYSTAILLLPLWAVRPVQSLSACTVQLYFYPPSGPYGLYRASVPVQYSYTSTHPLGRMACTEPQCLYSTAILLPTLWAVWPVQSLSAGTKFTLSLNPKTSNSETNKLNPLC